MNSINLDPASSDSVIEAVAKALKRKNLAGQQEAFARQVASDWRAEELPGVSLDALALNLAEFWRFAEAQAQPGADGAAPQIRLIPAKGHGGQALQLDLLQIVQEDRPFLVDSVMGELADAGLDVRAMFHPVVTLGGRETSMILVVLAPVGEDRRAGLIDGLKATLEDVRLAVTDFSAMTALMKTAAAELAASAAPDQTYGRDEYLAFLDWLTADRFVFLGARTYAYPRTAAGDYVAEEPVFRPEDGLGVLRDPTRSVLRRASEPAVLTSQLKLYLENAAPLAVAKSNLRSRVHRRAYMDYVGVKRYGPDGAAIGEVRFVGLFTLDAYEARAEDTPLVRKKVEHVIGRLGENPSAHTAKRLHNIVETYPRDELFQIDEGQLHEIAVGVLHLYDRPRVRLFTRVRIRFDRFVSGAVLRPARPLRLRACASACRRDDRWRLGVEGAHLGLATPRSRQRSPGARPLRAGRHAQASTRQPDIRRNWSARSPRRCAPGATGSEAALRAQPREPLRGGQAGGRPRSWPRYGPDAFSCRLPRPQRCGRDPDATWRRDGDASRGPTRRWHMRAYRDARPAPRKLSFRFKLYHQRRRRCRWPTCCPSSTTWASRRWTEDGFADQAPHRRGPERHRVGARVPSWRTPAATEPGVRPTMQARPSRRAFVAVWGGLRGERRLQPAGDGAWRVDWREAVAGARLGALPPAVGAGSVAACRSCTAALRDEPGIARALILDLFRLKFDPAVRRRRSRASARSKWTPPSPPSSRRCRGWRKPGRRPRPAPAGAPGAGDGSHQFLSDARPTASPKPYISFKVASRELDRPARAQALSARSSSASPRGGGRAPALRPRGPRRPALERPARRLPHRGAGPGQGAAGEERGDRAGGQQGRLLPQAA